MAERFTQQHVKLVEHLLGMGHDPLAYVKSAFPWGEPGTALARFPGPRSWQVQVCSDMRDHIAENLERVRQGLSPRVFKLAVAAGHGIGKSALAGMLMHWIQDTILGSTAIITANNEEQVRKMWSEFHRWDALVISNCLFSAGASLREPTPAYRLQIERETKIGADQYLAKWALWSESRPEGFAGTHSQAGVLLIIDEASGVPKQVWDECLGYFTDPILHRYWIVFSNPRLNTGEFYDLFQPGSGWRTMNIDSRTVEGVDIDYLNGIVEKYGEDSDEAGTRVIGRFPRQSEKQFIGRGVVDSAVNRELPDYVDLGAPLVMGVDIGGGVDPTVLVWRSGVDARSIPAVEINEADDTKIAREIAAHIDRTKPDAVFIDMGRGHGVKSILWNWGYRLRGVFFSGDSPDKQCLNMRAYMWQATKEWLADGGCIYGNGPLRDELCAPNKVEKETHDKIQLESKTDMKKRGVKSPNYADALALTFAGPVARLDLHGGKVIERYAIGSGDPVFRASVRGRTQESNRSWHARYK